MPKLVEKSNHIAVTQQARFVSSGCWQVAKHAVYGTLIDIVLDEMKNGSMPVFSCRCNIEILQLQLQFM